MRDDVRKLFGDGTSALKWDQLINRKNGFSWNVVCISFGGTSGELIPVNELLICGDE
jgi:hypothetical protein